MYKSFTWNLIKLYTFYAFMYQLNKEKFLSIASISYPLLYVWDIRNFISLIAMSGIIFLM